MLLCEEFMCVCNVMVNLVYLKIGMVVVFVKVWLKLVSLFVIIYVFLDSGSLLLFCIEFLMRQLGVDGILIWIFLIILEKKDSFIDSFVVKDFVIFDLDENVFIELLVFYMRLEIFVLKEDIFIQGDIDQWLYLCGVSLIEVDVEIGFFIVCDVFIIFDFLEVKCS